MSNANARPGKPQQGRVQQAAPLPRQIPVMAALQVEPVTLTRREWYAGQALAGLCRGAVIDTDQAVHLALSIADKMIAALDKPRAAE